MIEKRRACYTIVILIVVGSTAHLTIDELETIAGIVPRKWGISPAMLCLSAVV